MGLYAFRVRERPCSDCGKLGLRHEYELHTERRCGNCDPAFSLLRLCGCDQTKRTRRKAAARESRCDRSLDLSRRCAFPASDPGDDHGFAKIHCVSGRAGRQPILPPTGSARATEIRTSSPPNAARRAIKSASVSKVTALTTSRPPVPSAAMA